MCYTSDTLRVHLRCAHSTSWKESRATNPKERCMLSLLSHCHRRLWQLPKPPAKFPIRSTLWRCSCYSRCRGGFHLQTQSGKYSFKRRTSSVHGLRSASRCYHIGAYQIGQLLPTLASPCSRISTSWTKYFVRAPWSSGSLMFAHMSRLLTID